MMTGIVPHVGGPIIPPCHVTTLIAGLPAARVTDKALCVGPPDTIVKGAPTTTIGGLAAARRGDQTAHGGIIVMGCFTVLIGDATASGGAGGGAITSNAVRSSTGTLQGKVMREAKQSKKAFCLECALHRLEALMREQSAQSKSVRTAKANATPFCEVCGL